MSSSDVSWVLSVGLVGLLDRSLSRPLPGWRAPRGEARRCTPVRNRALCVCVCVWQALSAKKQKETNQPTNHTQMFSFLCARSPYRGLALGDPEEEAGLSLLFSSSPAWQRSNGRYHGRVTLPPSSSLLSLSFTMWLFSSCLLVIYSSIRRG